MSTTQVSQTLFRFVSVRNPQLTDNTGKDKRFVFRSDLVKNQPATVNVFDAAIANGGNAPKLGLLAAAAVPFKTSTAYLAEEKAVENLAGSNLYQFASWLARNRDSFNNAELLTKSIAVGAPLTTTQLATLWNNLFYQVVTQESFYVKEAIMHLLAANHVVINFDNNEDAAKGFANNQLVAKAVVVLPKELFLEESDNNSNAVARAQTSVAVNPVQKNATESMKQAQTVLNAKHFNEKYDSLKKEIENAEKDYRKAYQLAYEAAYKAHQEVIKPQMTQYLEDRDAAKAAWCAARQADTIKLDKDDPCNQPPILREPELPQFTFSFQSETAYLQERLTADAIELLNNLSGIKTSTGNGETEMVAGMVSGAVPSIAADSFSSVYENLGRGIAQNNEAIISNSRNEADSIVIVGGIPIETASRNATAFFDYQICPRVYMGRALFDMEFTVPDSSWVFSDIEYTNLDLNSFPGFSHYLTYDRVGNTLFLSSLFGDDDYPFFIYNNYPEINGTIYFTNGKRRKFKISLAGYDYKLCSFGQLTDPDNTGGGGTGGDPGDETEVFKPTGFGVKQLGIADYKKVEQTVHCYVEGEVAHIENIMAREYKEKSTRRLRKSENTSTSSAESESEQLSDTTSTDRFEMQSEVAKVMQQSRDFSANASVSGTKFGITVNAGANFATHNSKEQSTRAAITQAKDITQRAMDRVVSRVKEERIEKIIEEFEENNKHGFDNTKGDKHVVGVYRWVDKIYKNQIFNFGKRLMFEFMIPEPAKLHYLGMKESKDSNAGKVLVKPIDPRTATQMTIATSAFVGENQAKYWAAFYNAEIEPMPAEYIYSGKSYADTKVGADECYSKSENLEIKEGYTAVNANTFIYGVWDTDSRQRHSIGLTVGNAFRFMNEQRYDFSYENSFALSNIEGFLPISYQVLNYHAFNISVTVKLQRTYALLSQWQLQTFNAIIKAYEKALAQYEDELAEQQAVAQTIKGTNPGFYRDIENMVLRKNCISYLINQNPAAKLTYGKQMYKTAGQDSFTGYEVDVTKTLDDYTAFAKFLEQAFEWNIMSYYFYPFYWGNKADWPTLYQYDNNDPVFRSFMQSGLARVVVTVRPGFEDAVRFYMQTGLVWNGGEVPVIDDPLHLSIIDELKEPEGKPEGKAWATRIPTSLTILQADSIGLKVEKALPCNCDDVTMDTWENPAAVPCGDNFVVTQHMLNSGEQNNKVVQFSFTKMDLHGFTTISLLDQYNLFPRVYECMGQQIEINRDASWKPEESTKVIFEKLAAQLSLIPGVKAVQKTAENNNPAGIQFTVDGNINPLFTFVKPGGSENYDILKVSINADSVRFAAPQLYLDKVSDRFDTSLRETDTDTLLPIGRFKV
jgi:hypothetical protein